MGRSILYNDGRGSAAVGPNQALEGQEMSSDRDQTELARLLLDLGAVSLSPRQPYTWASGLKAPIYCDNRLIISDVAARRRVADGFARLLTARAWRPNLIAGAATAGIPHAAWLAEKLDLPMVYVRASAKKHGKQNRIEGAPPPHARAVVIEDLISTGGSSIRVAEALRADDVEVLGVAAIFQYGMAKAAANFQEADLDWASLTDLTALLAVAAGDGRLSGSETAMVDAWRRDPAAWSENARVE